MIVNKKNHGTYTSYELQGNRISLGADELTIDLAGCQRDYPVHLDISENAEGILVVGPSQRYIAEIDIPAREWTIVKGETDDLGFPKLTKTALPFDTQKVVLTLWAREV